METRRYITNGVIGSLILIFFNCKSEKGLVAIKNNSTKLELNGLYLKGYFSYVGKWMEKSNKYEILDSVYKYQGFSFYRNGVLRLVQVDSVDTKKAIVSKNSSWGTYEIIMDTIKVNIPAPTMGSSILFYEGKIINNVLFQLTRVRCGNCSKFDNQSKWLIRDETYKFFPNKSKFDSINEFIKYK